eukprot:3588024-Rhodomonas_salina.1
MQPSIAPSGEPDTAREACQTQSTRTLPGISPRSVSNHSTGTEISACTAHNCVASVESSSQFTIVVALGRPAAADRRVYRPESSRPLITPTSTGGGRQPSFSWSPSGLCGRGRSSGIGGGGRVPSPLGSRLSARRWSCHAHWLSASLGNHSSRGSICGPGIGTPPSGRHDSIKGLQEGGIGLAGRPETCRPGCPLSPLIGRREEQLFYQREAPGSEPVQPLFDAP